jgi:F-type H+-transporting ATPase subunit gamma
MAQTQELKRRIRSVKNAKQITKALEVVAAGRMRKVQSAVEVTREYSDIAVSIIRRVAPSQEAQTHPYFKKVSDAKKLYIVFTSDRGQAGAFNSNIFHAVTQSMHEDKQGGMRPQVIVFGRKGARFFSKLSDITLSGVYEDVADTPDTNIFAPILETIQEGFTSGGLNKVVLVYTQFISALSQKVQLKELLPIAVEDAAEGTENANLVYEFEPSLESVLEEALRLYFESQLMQARIESATSEYAMRMIAMGNANRNAGDLIDSYTLELNAARQAVITQEIAEITGGAAAIAE